MKDPHPARNNVYQLHQDQPQPSHPQDPYLIRKKWPDPTCCPYCGAVYHNGHWQLQVEGNDHAGEERERDDLQAEDHLERKSDGPKHALTSSWDRYRYD